MQHNDITGAANNLHTSQLAVPKDVCDTVFARAEGYSASVQNLSQLTLETDNVFSDTGASSQLVTVTGDMTSGYTFKLNIGVAI